MQVNNRPFNLHLKIQVLRNQGLFQTRGNLDFFSRSPPRKKSQVNTLNKFETDLDFQKSRCRLKGRKFNLKRLEPENKSLCFTHVHNSSSIRNYTGRSSQLTVINDLNLSFIKVCCQQQTGTSAYFSEKFYENDDGWIRNALIPSHYL